MAIAALIIVGVLLVSSTLIASLLVQNRIERRESRKAQGGDGSIAAREEDEYSQRLRTALRSRLSHELRTPLNSIITLSQLLMEDDGATLTVEQRRYIEVIRRNGRSLLALVDQLAEGAPSPHLEDDARDGVAADDPHHAALEPEMVEANGGAMPEAAAGAGAVLLIEDDPIERQRIGSFIEAAGYKVTRAASGEEGLALMRSRPFAVVVLDLIMPDMTGLDVLRAARTEDRLGDVRFVVLSAMYMTANERQVLGPKVTDVVRKGETMARALTFALERASRSAHPEAHPHHGDGGGRHL
jgi:CheY-like chemotaxis protein